MAARGKKQTRRLRFELSWSAVAGLGVVAFCLFLWMFLLGVWAGQSLLRPVDEGMVTAAPAVVPEVIRADQKAVKNSTGKMSPQ